MISIGNSIHFLIRNILKKMSYHYISSAYYPYWISVGEQFSHKSQWYPFENPLNENQPVPHEQWRNTVYSYRLQLWIANAWYLVQCKTPFLNWCAGVTRVFEIIFLCHFPTLINVMLCAYGVARRGLKVKLLSNHLIEQMNKATLFVTFTKRAYLHEFNP